MDWKALTKLDEEEESNIQEVIKYFSFFDPAKICIKGDILKDT